MNPRIPPLAHARLHAQRGLALPVMLIVLAVMLVTSIYMFKSSHSAALTTGNLAYEDAMSRAADFGVVSGFQWLSTTAAGAKATLNSDVAAQGYKASFDTTLSASSPEFWNGARTVVDPAGNRIEYIVHRLCALPTAHDALGNNCVQTAANTSTHNNAVAIGASLASDSPAYAGSPQLHYVITARIFGTRGGNVVNQTVVLIGV